jgi:histidinol-phosphatase (PHP family)
MAILTDLHTHTTFSADGKATLSAMYKAAEAHELAFWGISEHFDYDYKVNNILYCGKEIAYIDEHAYFSAAKVLQRDNRTMCILVGAEFGFARNPEVHSLYIQAIEAHAPDYVINSVHTNGRYDYADPEAFAGRDKNDVYGEYLSIVRESLDAPYHYDIVGHLGYCTRKAPYTDRVMHYADFADQLDDILKTVIAKDKILEVNSSVTNQPTEFLPYREILERYYALGGRKVSYGSDAHDTKRLCDKRAQILEMLKEIGFTHLTIPFRGKRFKVAI